MERISAPPVSLLDIYEGSEFLPLYSTSVTVHGGEASHARSSGHARSADGELDLQLRLPSGGGAAARTRSNCSPPVMPRVSTAP
jgi:hypothetical protein